jgi:hypothetical protein
MASGPEARKERIERLLQELKYEITRGMMEREIDEHLGFRFIVPVSASLRHGIVFCEFHTRPQHPDFTTFDVAEPRLRIVK